MLWLVFALYWIVAGFAVLMVGPPTKDLRVAAICFLLGGFIVPALVIAKILQ
jgi:hypothetical protein